MPVVLIDVDHQREARRVRASGRVVVHGVSILVVEVLSGGGELPPGGLSK